MKQPRFVSLGMFLLSLAVVILSLSTPASTVSAFHHNQFEFSLSSQHHRSHEMIIPTTALFQTPKQSAMHSVVVSIEEDAPRDVVAFDEWATSCGVQKVDGFQLTMNNEDIYTGIDFGVVTTQDIPVGQPVLFVPHQMILTGTKAREELGIAQTAEMLLERLQTTDQLPQFYIFLKVLKEWELGNQSPWYPWLNSLPRYYSNGSSMTHFCCRILPPLVGNLTNKERVRFRQFYKALDYVDFLDEQTKKNRDLAKWAYAVTYTRSFPIADGGTGDVQIVPMADMFNHGTQTEIEVRTDDEGYCYAHTTYDVPAGSPLRMSYGCPTNPSLLFARFGFLDESSPATFCKIMIDNPSQELINMGYDQSRMLFYKDTGDVSPEVWDVLLYQLLGGYDPEQQQAFYNAHMNGDNETKQSMHAMYFENTKSALKSHVDNFVQELDKLSENAVGRDESTHPRLPLLMKHNEFVKSTFLMVKARILEYC